APRPGRGRGWGAPAAGCPGRPRRVQTAGGPAPLPGRRDGERRSLRALLVWRTWPGASRPPLPVRRPAGGGRPRRLVPRARGVRRGGWRGGGGRGVGGGGGVEPNPPPRAPFCPV